MIPKRDTRFRQAPIPVILSFDPAIDMERSKFEEYVRTRKLEHLAFKEGQSPTIFYVRHLPKVCFEQVMGAGLSPWEQYRLAFQWGIERIQTLKDIVLHPGMELEGGTIPLWEPSEEMVVGPKTIKVIAKEDLEDTFSPVVVYEIGHFIFSNCFLANGIVRPYLLPGTSTLLLRTIQTLQMSDSAESKSAANQDNPTDSVKDSMTKSDT